MPDYEQELLIRCGKGDEGAFAELYSRFSGPILSFFIRCGIEGKRAEELTQEVFVRIWNAAKRYKPLAKASTYIFTVAHNLAKNEFVKRRVESMEQEPVSEDVVEHLPIDEILKDLSSEERAVLTLFYVQGFTHSEISEVLGIPEGTVKSRIFYALKKLHDRQ